MAGIRKRRPCNFRDCPNEARAKELCWGHYQQLRRGQALKPLKPYRRSSLNNLRIVPWRRPSGEDAIWCERSGKMLTGEVIDWLVTRSPDGSEGPKVARTIRAGGEMRCYWWEGYLAYAPNEEFPTVCALVEEAIQAQYEDAPARLGFERSTVCERGEDHGFDAA